MRAAGTGAGPRSIAARDVPARVDQPGEVSAAFWVLLALALAVVAGDYFAIWSIDSSLVTVMAVAVMLIGGLPHGACDLSLAAKAFGAGRGELVLVVAGYLAVAGAMAAMWHQAPLMALICFTALAAFHFGEDWTMLPGGLLRSVAGLAVITTASLGHQSAVTALFAAMTEAQEAPTIAQWLAASAPMTWLVTSVGLYLAWQAGHRAWVMAYVLAYICLFMLPPVIGFTIFFVGLHAPRHWRQSIRIMPAAFRRRAAREGAALTLLSLALWGGWLAWHPVAGGIALGGEAFRLLSILAAPHLALSLAMERRLEGHASGAADRLTC